MGKVKFWGKWRILFKKQSPRFHRHKLPNFTQFMDFTDRARKGLPLAEHLCLNPYSEIERILIGREVLEI